MGLFNRKSTRINTNGDIHSTHSAKSDDHSLKSPPPTKTSRGELFVSPSALDVSLPPPPDPTLDPAAYLRSIYAVRARSSLVYQRAKRNQLAHFDVDSSKFRDTAAYVVSIIKVRDLIKTILDEAHTPSTERLRA